MPERIIKILIITDKSGENIKEAVGLVDFSWTVLNVFWGQEAMDLLQVNHFDLIIMDEPREKDVLKNNLINLAGAKDIPLVLYSNKEKCPDIFTGFLNHHIKVEALRSLLFKIIYDMEFPT